MAGTQVARKHLSADALMALVRSSFVNVADPRPGIPTIPLADALVSAFAMFALKDPSLLAFEQQRVRAEREAAGYPFMNEEEVTAYIEELRADDDRIEEAYRQDEEARTKEARSD